MGFWGWAAAIAAGWFTASALFAIAWNTVGKRIFRKPPQPPLRRHNVIEFARDETADRARRIAAAERMGKAWINCLTEGPDGYVCTERVYRNDGYRHTGDHVVVGRAEGEPDGEITRWANVSPKARA